MNNYHLQKQCQHAWEQICLPIIKYNQSWSAQEDQLLLSLVKIHGTHGDQWKIIALSFVSYTNFSHIKKHFSN